MGWCSCPGQFCVALSVEVLILTFNIPYQYMATYHNLHWRSLPDPTWQHGMMATLLVTMAMTSTATTGLNMLAKEEHGNNN